MLINGLWAVYINCDQSIFTNVRAYVMKIHASVNGNNSQIVSLVYVLMRSK